jgi:hypothetical protein
MALWEYRIIGLVRNVNRDSSKTVREFTAELGQAGDEGWEAVGEMPIYNGNNPPMRFLLLKRPKNGLGRP